MIERIDKLMSSSKKIGGISKQIKTAMIADVALGVLQIKFGHNEKKMRVRRVKAGTISVTCECSVLAEEIRLHEPDLIAEINNQLKDQKIERIVATT